MKTNLFSWPIYQIKIDPNLYDKEKIINDIKYNKSLKNTRNDLHQRIGRDNSNIHHSYADFDNKNFRPINYEKLTEVYQKTFTDFLNKKLITIKNFKWNFYIENYSAITEGQWLPNHGHGTNDFACIHYLNFKKDHNQTTFENPASFARYAQMIHPELVNVLNL